MKKTFRDLAKTKSQRWAQARKSGEKPVLEGLGVFGIIGWSVVIPLLLGIMLGVWLKSYIWTLIFLIAGLVLGCILAWKLSIREITPKDKKNGKPK